MMKVNAECCKDSLALLKFLAEQRHKCSKNKLQFVQESVKFLGHTISQSSKSLTTWRIKMISELPYPDT